MIAKTDGGDALTRFQFALVNNPQTYTDLRGMFDRAMEGNDYRDALALLRSIKVDADAVRSSGRTPDLLEKWSIDIVDDPKTWGDLRRMQQRQGQRARARA